MEMLSTQALQSMANETAALGPFVQDVVVPAVQTHIMPTLASLASTVHDTAAEYLPIAYDATCSGISTGISTAYHLTTTYGPVVGSGLYTAASGAVSLGGNILSGTASAAGAIVTNLPSFAQIRASAAFLMLGAWGLDQLFSLPAVAAVTEPMFHAARVALGTAGTNI